MWFNLEIFNPWWIEKKVPSNFVGRKRKILYEAIKLLNTKQILIITGLRRVGKTTLIYQMIDELLKEGVEPFNILYYSFDEVGRDLQEIIKYYEINILKQKISSERKVYLFLDEIQKLKNWASKVKILYDLNPNLKIVLTGSAQITTWKDSLESLAGRFFELRVKPLDFEEYLAFKDIKIDVEREDLYKDILRLYFTEYLKTGGFIEAFELDDYMLRKYFKESIIDRVIFIDIPQLSSIDYPDLLIKIIQITAERPGFLLDYKNLSNDLDVDHRTLENYISYLKYALFLQKVYNYSKSIIKRERKIKKLYLTNSAFTLALNNGVEFSILLEQFFVNYLESKFFYRTPQKEEIDIIYLRNGVILPIEIKIREKIDMRDVKVLFHFMEKEKIRKSIVITLDIEKELIKDEFSIKLIPYWKYWSIRKEIGV